MKTYDDFKTDSREQVNDFASDIYLWSNDKLIAEYCFFKRYLGAHIQLVYDLALSAGLADLDHDDTYVYEKLKDSAIMEQAREVMRQELIEDREWNN